LLQQNKFGLAMKDDNIRNTILAMALSVLVLVVWQYFVVGPRIAQEKARAAALQSQQQQGKQGQGQATPSGAPVPAAAAAPMLKARDKALAESTRVKIDTPSLTGSVSLRGGRIDDLALKNYRVSVEKNSPNIMLFSPSGAPDAYYAEMGYVAAGDMKVQVPDGSTMWSLREGFALTPDMPIRLEYNNGQGLTFRRAYTVDDHYLFTVTDEVVNNRGEAVTLYPYALISRHGVPKGSKIYVIHEGGIGYFGETGLHEISYAKLDDTLQVKENAHTGWLGITDKYWAAAVIPDQKTGFEGRFSSLQQNQQKTYQADYLLDAQTVSPAATLKITHRIFAGAKEVAVVDNYRTQFGIDHFDLLIDWGWFYFFTKPLFWTIDYIYKLIGNFGLAILAVTVLLKTLFFPLANRSYVSMSKMKKVQPEMAAIKERYPDDKMKQQQELMELYKREKINPVAGCLPVLVQIPVFFALYKVIYVSIEMRHAPFFGWIHDLSAPDPTNVFNLFGLIPFNVPFLHLGALPLIMGITMFLQMKMNPEPTDPVQKTLFTWMPLIFTFMLASFPAGLVLYWAWNNLLSITQQAVIMKRQGVKVELFDNIAKLFRKKERLPADGTG
jgi:YidC/Oxa1 family membrane protein insertase